MGGYAFLMCQCFVCPTIMMANPNHVPSLVIKGQREPICRNCFEYRQELRAKMGLEPETLHPNAYEAEPEELL